MICQFKKLLLVWESHKMIVIGHLVLFHNGHEIYLKKSTSSCFVNNYSPVLLKTWELNLIIQPVHNYFKALTYMTGYSSKSEREVSESWKQAVMEIKNQNLNVRDALKKIAYSFISSRQLSVQEAVYNALPEMWLRKYSPGISFINTNLPNNRIWMIKSKEELELLPDNSTDIFKKSIIDRYVDRATSRKFPSLKTVCLGQIASLYYKKLLQIMIIRQIIKKKTLKKKIIVTQHFQQNRSKKVSRSND